MKSCEEIREQLSFYLDNELHENDRKQVVKHLEGCDACKAELNQLKDVIESIGEIEEAEVPADFETKLHEKLVEVHKKSDSTGWTNKGRIYKWASAMVAGFVLLFAVVNRGYFSQLTQFGNSTKTAYVNDTHLDTVDKQAMNSIVQRQEMAENSAQAAKPGPSVQSQPLNNTKSKTVVPASSAVTSSSETKSVTPTIKNNDVVNNTLSPTAAKKVNLPPETSSMILAVDNVTAAVDKINDIAIASGGTVQQQPQSQPQVYGIMSASISNDTEELTLQIPASTYNQFVGAVEKMGTVQIQPDNQNANMQTKSSTLRRADASASLPDMVTVKMSIQKK